MSDGARERDEKRERQRRLFLRYFDEFEATLGRDPNEVMRLAFSINSGVFLRRAIAGMELFRDRAWPPIEFFWMIENASDELRDVLFNFLKREKEWNRLLRKARRARARLTVLLDAERERRRERDEPGLTAKEKATRAARAPMNAAHRKALQRTRDELGMDRGTKKLSHGKST